MPRNKLNSQIPNNWNELTTKQLVCFAKIIFKKEENSKTDLQLFYMLLQLKWWQFIKKRKALKVLKYYTIDDLKKHYSWLYKSVLRTKFIPLPKHTGPGDRLHNISIQEFAVTEDLFRLFWETKDLKYIHYMAAVLYVPTPYPTRPVFVKENLENLAKKIKTTKKQRLALVVCYLGAKEYLAKEFRLVFPKPKANNQANTNTGLDPVILEMSGHKFGTHSQTQTTNLYVFLKEFNNQLKQLQHAQSSS